MVEIWLRHAKVVVHEDDVVADGLVVCRECQVATLVVGQFVAYPPHQLNVEFGEHGQRTRVVPLFAFPSLDRLTGWIKEEAAEAGAPVDQLVQALVRIMLTEQVQRQTHRSYRAGAVKENLGRYGG